MTTAAAITEDGLHMVFTWPINQESETSGDEDLSDKFYPALERSPWHRTT